MESTKLKKRKTYFWRRMNMDRSFDLGSSSSMLFEFRLFDILRRPAASEDDDGSSFFGVNAVLRLISTLDDCVVPMEEPNESKCQKGNISVDSNSYMSS